MAKTTAIPYSPGSPPGADTASLARATWDEFFKIQQSLVDLDRPASIAASDTEAATVSAGISYSRLFNESPVIDYQWPGGQLDGATGIWTCPQEGLYLIIPVVQVPAFPTPASKLYTANMRLTFQYANGSTREIVATVGGDDRVALRLQPVVMLPFVRGDKLFCDLDLTHETKTGTVDVVAILNITRQSGSR